jgi:hypothetical protein
MTANRHQHHVPQAYLRHFADPDRLRVYVRPEKGSTILREFETTTKNVAHRRDLYTMHTESGERDNTFDDNLRIVEDEIHNALEPVLAGRDLNDDDWVNVMALAAVQDGRKPSAVDEASRFIGEVHEQGRYLYRQHRPELSEAEIDDLLRENWGPTTLSGAAALNPKNLARQVLNSTVFEFVDIFTNLYNACLVTSVAHDFFTSDRPVTYFDPVVKQDRFGFDRSSPTIEITYPLTRRHLLFMSHLPLPPYVRAKKAAVTILNSRTVYGSAAQVYAYPTSDPRARARQRRDAFSTLGSLNITCLILAATLDAQTREAVRPPEMGARWAGLMSVFEPGRA